MKKLLILTIMILSGQLYAENNYKEDIFHDFIIDPINFSNSIFNKTLSKSDDNNKFFNTFVIDKEFAKSLSTNNSISDVLNICYEMYANREQDKFEKLPNEGKLCLYHYAVSGYSEAYSYISMYHFDKYKEIIVFNNEVSVDNLIKMSVYAGLADSSHIKSSKKGILDSQITSFTDIISQPVIKIKNKNILNSYYNQGTLLHLALPINSSTYNAVNQDFYNEIIQSYESKLEENSGIIYKDIRKNNFKTLQQSIINDHQVDNITKKYQGIVDEVTALNPKSSSDFSKICKDSLFGYKEYQIDKKLAEYCLVQTTLTEMNGNSAYDLGIYFYVLASNISDDAELIVEYNRSSLVWLALSLELGNPNANKVFTRIMLNPIFKDKQIEVIKEYNFNRKIARSLIDQKIKIK